MANVAEILIDITTMVLSGGSSTTALSLRTIYTKIVNSYPNFQDGGKLFEVEVGYKGTFRPSSAGAFATVDMLGAAGSAEVTDGITIALLEDDTNWTNNIYSGAAIVTQNPGDFYINNYCDYKFFTLSGVVTVRRIPFSLL